MLDFNYRLLCRHCRKKSIVKLQVGDFRRDMTVRCEHCQGECRINREQLQALLENLHQFKKHIKI